MNYPLNASQYEVLRSIGNTTYSKVSVARCITNGKLVALKEIDLELYPLKMDELRKEVSFWATTTHENMMKYYGSFIEKSILYVIAEFVDGGSLIDILRYQYQDGLGDEVLIASIMKSILSFLKYYHQTHHIHRRLETRNVLMSFNGAVKVGGFWRARSLLQAGRLQYERASVIDSSCYTAPELLENGVGYSQSVDIWSIGIIAIELATGKAPFSELTPLEQVKTIIDSPAPSLPDIIHYSPAFRDFVAQCLRKSPNKRPSARELLKHKFISFAKNSDYVNATMMIHLPPLSQRVILQKKNSDDVLGTLVDLHKPEKILFDFGVEAESVNKGSIKADDFLPVPEPQSTIVRKGRFTLTIPSKSTNMVSAHSANDVTSIASFNAKRQNLISTSPIRLVE